MIYEFFGLPGSGKTYLAERFSQNKQMPLVEVRGNVAKYTWAFIFACARPRIFFSFLKELIKENKQYPGLLRYKINTLYLRAVAKEGKALARKDAVIDEGLFQVLLYIFEKEITERDIASCARFLKKRNIHIVEASHAVRRERMKARGRFPRAFLGEEYLQQWFPVLEKNYALIRELIKAKFPHIEVFNER